MSAQISCFLQSRPRVLNALHALHVTQPTSATIESELACLEKYARNRTLAIEIGTAMGISAMRIARVLAPTAKLYCVDPYDADSPVWAICKRGLRRAGVIHNIIFLRGTSDAMRTQLPLNCDFIFVDGDHSYEGLKTDWSIILDCLAVGGIACFHDTTIPREEPFRKPGSVQFFQEVILPHTSFQHLETVYSLNVLKRIY